MSSNQSRSNSFHSNSGYTPPESPRDLNGTHRKGSLTQSDILRSRIDEQSNLICVLKNRNDQLLAKINASDTQNEILITQQSTLKTQIFDENKRFNQLEDHFNTLAKNHQEMINIKDEYKFGNEKLNGDNKGLVLENLRLKKELNSKDNEKITKLTLEITSLQNSLKLEADLLNHQRGINIEGITKLMEADEKIQKQIILIKNDSKTIKNLDEKIFKMEEKFKTESDIQNKMIKELKNEQEKLVSSNFKRGELLGKLERENDQCKCKVEELTEKIKLLEQKWKDECDKIDTDCKVKSLMQELSECHAEIGELEMHKSRLRAELTNQKQLCERLRDYKWKPIIKALNDE